MTRKSLMTLAVAVVATVILLLPGRGWTADLPEGVSIDVLAEYGSKTPGVDKILFRRITLKPGATWSFTVPAQSLCEATKGELEVADQTTGKTHVFKVGDRWDTSPGHKVTLSNKSSSDHEHLFYTMVVKK